MGHTMGLMSATIQFYDNMTHIGTADVYYAIIDIDIIDLYPINHYLFVKITII